jgi:hypothetical protein
MTRNWDAELDGRVKPQAAPDRCLLWCSMKPFGLTNHCYRRLR